MNEPHQHPRRRRILAMLTALIFAIIAIPSTLTATSVFAATPAAPVTVVGDPHTVTLTPMAWTIITGLILPFVIAAITKAVASSTFKGVVAIIVAAVGAAVERATLADGTAVFTTGLMLDIAAVYVPQLLTYLGLWQHVNLNSKVAPRFGIGG